MAAREHDVAYSFGHLVGTAAEAVAVHEVVVAIASAALVARVMETLHRVGVAVEHLHDVLFAGDEDGVDADGHVEHLRLAARLVAE